MLLRNLLMMCIAPQRSRAARCRSLRHMNMRSLGQNVTRRRKNVWFVVCGVFCLLFVVCCLVFVVCGLWFVVCGLWFVVCGLWFVVCGLWFAVCDSSKTAAHLAATCAIGWSLSSTSLTQIQNASSQAMAARLLWGVGAWWRWWWWWWWW